MGNHTPMAKAPPKSLRTTHGQGSREWSTTPDCLIFIYFSSFVGGRFCSSLALGIGERTGRNGEGKKERERERIARGSLCVYLRCGG